VNGKFVIVLNVNNVMSTEEISQMGQVAACRLMCQPRKLTSRAGP
jgi:hypothetical protein